VEQADRHSLDRTHGGLETGTFYISKAECPFPVFRSRRNPQLKSCAGVVGRAEPMPVLFRRHGSLGRR